MLDGVNVIAVNRGDRLAITSADIIGSIKVWLDDEGDETDDAGVAVVAIVQWPDGSWSPVDLRDFEGGEH